MHVIEPCARAYVVATGLFSRRHGMKLSTHFRSLFGFWETGKKVAKWPSPDLSAVSQAVLLNISPQDLRLFCFVLFCFVLFVLKLPVLPEWASATTGTAGTFPNVYHGSQGYG